MEIGYIKVKAIVDSKEEKIEILKDDELRIYVKMPAERNLANNELIEMLKKHYMTNHVRLVSGHHSTSKIFYIGK